MSAILKGSIELTVSNADKTDGFKFQVLLENESGVVKDEEVVGATTWACLNAVPGQYKISVRAIAEGKPLGVSIVTEVKSGTTSKPLVALPLNETSRTKAESSGRTAADLLAGFALSSTIFGVMTGALRYARQSRGFFCEELFRSTLQYGRNDDQSAAGFTWLVLTQEVGEQHLSEMFPLPRFDSLPDPSSVFVSSEVWAAFESASSIRQETGGRDRFLGLRHILFSLAATNESRPKFNAVLSPLGINADWIAAKLVEFLQKSLEQPNESWDAWLAIFHRAGLDVVSGSGMSQTTASISGSGQAPPPTAAPQPSKIERLPTQADDPATVDELGRRPFAEVIAQRIEDVWKRELGEGKPNSGSGAFMIHIDGPWGSGKSSVLNFLRDHLRAGSSGREWVVVGFNAWRNQRIRPPWWALITGVYAQARTQIGFRRAWVLRLKWWLWIMRLDWMPRILAFAIMAATFLTARFLPAGMELAIKIISLVPFIWVFVSPLTRAIFFGSARAAQSYSELRTDPLRPIIRLFEKLIASIRRPVVVLVDDLDRCESKYVIELLEGIQTLLRTTPLIYVVAADRKWICSSFEKAYEDFHNVVGEPGRPLGYLFLDKVFQISASVPQISADKQREFWEVLLRANPSRNSKALDQYRQQKEFEARDKVKDLNKKEELDVAIAAENDPVSQQAMRAAAAKQITSTVAELETEHRLRPFSGLLEPNPRSMKRLVNAYGLHRATHFLEGRSVSPEALARWTIVELRWPLLAEYLARNPRRIEDIGSKDGKDIPESFKELFGDEEVIAVVSGSIETSPALNESTI